MQYAAPAAAGAPDAQVSSTVSLDLGTGQIAQLPTVPQVPADSSQVGNVVPQIQMNPSLGVAGIGQQGQLAPSVQQQVQPQQPPAAVPAPAPFGPAPLGASTQGDVIYQQGQIDPSLVLAGLAGTGQLAAPTQQAPILPPSAVGAPQAGDVSGLQGSLQQQAGHFGNSPPPAKQARAAPSLQQQQNLQQQSQNLQQLQQQQTLQQQQQQQQHHGSGPLFNFGSNQTTGIRSQNPHGYHSASEGYVMNANFDLNNE